MTRTMNARHLMLIDRVQLTRTAVSRLYRKARKEKNWRLWVVCWTALIILRCHLEIARADMVRFGYLLIDDFYIKLIEVFGSCETPDDVAFALTRWEAGAWRE